MKKILIISILSFAYLVGFAQINRTIWGVTLGKSTKSNVRAVLINKGFSVHTSSKGGYSILTTGIYFGGENWSYASFDFADGLLFKVSFQNNKDDSEALPESVYERLKIALDKKYGRYYYNLVTRDEVTAWSNYSDGKTNILLGLRNHNTEYVNLIYYDTYLMQKTIQKENDEL